MASANQEYIIGGQSFQRDGEVFLKGEKFSPPPEMSEQEVAGLVKAGVFVFPVEGAPAPAASERRARARAMKEGE